MKNIIIAGIAAVLLVGCSEEAVKEETKAVEQKEEKSVVKGEEFNESQYTQDMSAAMKNVSEALGLISEESTKFSENPALMMDQGWLMDMAMAITLLDSSIIQVRGIEEPEGKELKEAHALVLKAMDQYQYVVDHYPSAIDNMDADAIRKCTESLSTATGYIQQATVIITDYQESK